MKYPRFAISKKRGYLISYFKKNLACIFSQRPKVIKQPREQYFKEQCKEVVKAFPLKLILCGIFDSKKLGNAEDKRASFFENLQSFLFSVTLSDKQREAFKERNAIKVPNSLIFFEVKESTQLVRYFSFNASFYCKAMLSNTLNLSEAALLQSTLLFKSSKVLKSKKMSIERSCFLRGHM